MTRAVRSAAAAVGKEKSPSATAIRYASASTTRRAPCPLERRSIFAIVAVNIRVPHASLESGGAGYDTGKGAEHEALAASMAAGSLLPSVLSPRVCDRLPLHVRDGVGSATSERLYVIFPVAGAGAARSAGRWARVLPLKFPCYLAGSVLF